MWARLKGQDSSTQRLGEGTDVCDRSYKYCGKLMFFDKKGAEFGMHFHGHKR